MAADEGRDVQVVESEDVDGLAALEGEIAARLRPKRNRGAVSDVDAVIGLKGQVLGSAEGAFEDHRTAIHFCCKFRARIRVNIARGINIPHLDIASRESSGC